MKPKKRKPRRQASKKDEVKREAASTPSFKELLLAIPQDDGEFERIKIEFRDVDFGEP